MKQGKYFGPYFHFRLFAQEQPSVAPSPPVNVAATPQAIDPSMTPPPPRQAGSSPRSESWRDRYYSHRDTARCA